MKIRILLIITFMVSQLAFAQNNKGSLKGTVTTSDGQRAYMVSVSLKGTSKGSTTNHNGEYELKNVEAGNYTLVTSFVGLETKEVEVEVKAGQVTAVQEVVLVENAQQLEQVVVSASKDKYTTADPSSSLRLGEPLIEAPQNIQVVSLGMLKDQQVLSMSDGLIRNVSGAVRMEHWGDLYTNIVSRGAQVQAFRNGFNVVNSYWGPLTEDMSYVDHIEFVKGPAGFMLSNGDPAGLYNVVTKKPSGQRRGEVSATVGSYNLYRGTIDLDGKVTKNGKLLYRFNGAAKKSETHRNGEHNNRYSLAPVLAYKFSERSKLTVEYTMQWADMTDVGSFYIFAPDGFAKYPKDLSIMAKGLPDTKIKDQSTFVNFEHNFNDHWKLTTQGSYFYYDQDGSSMWPSVVNADGTFIRSVGVWKARSEMQMAQAFLNGDFNTGAIHHRVLTGVDLAKKGYAADWSQSHNLDTPGQPFDPRNPDNGAPVNGLPEFEDIYISTTGTQKLQYGSFYLQDELGFFDNAVRLTLAGRYTWVKQSYFSPDNRARHITPRVGLSWTVAENTAVYALYDQAFTPQTGVLSNGGEVQPITGNNWEVGFKRDWFGGRWSSTLAFYNILKNNELVTDPNAPANSGLSIELGQKRARGIEFDVKGTVTKGLTLTANYALTESIVNQVNDAGTGVEEGDKVPGYAKHVANAWLSYKIQNGFLKGSGVNLGFTYMIDRQTYWDPSPNGEALPNYFKLDGGLFWENNKLKVTANVFNILDEYLYSGSYYAWLNAFYWQSEAPRNARISVAYSF